jgi:hypothetical protein
MSPSPLLTFIPNWRLFKCDNAVEGTMSNASSTKLYLLLNMDLSNRNIQKKHWTKGGEHNCISVCVKCHEAKFGDEKVGDVTLGDGISDATYVDEI